MTAFDPKRWPCWACFLLLQCAAMPCVLGQERIFPEQNFAITIPPGWEWMANPFSKPGVGAVAHNRDKSKLIVITIYQAEKAMEPMDEHFVADMEQGITKAGGGPRISGRFVEIAGLKGYERLGNLTANGVILSSLTWTVPTAENRAYNIQFLCRNGPADEDAEFPICVASFRFLKQPKPPVAIKPWVNTSSPAYRTGYEVGQLAAKVTFSFLGGLIAMAVIVTLIRTWVRPKPPQPPPLP